MALFEQALWGKKQDPLRHGWVRAGLKVALGGSWKKVKGLLIGWELNSHETRRAWVLEQQLCGNWLDQIFVGDEFQPQTACGFGCIAIWK